MKLALLGRGGKRTVVEVADGRLRWATTQLIPERFLDRLQAERAAAPRRAPLGDAHGAWQKVGELPLALVLQHIPPDAWEDGKAWSRLLDDRDLRRFRADGDHRRF